MEADFSADAPLVLVIDDDEGNRELFQLALERAGLRVSAARDANEARTLITATTPNVVVTDVRMPLGDGVAIVRALRADRALDGVPILFVTGYPLKADDLKPLQDQGLVDALLQPFKPDVLVKFVRSLLARTESRKARPRARAATRRAAELNAHAHKLIRNSERLMEDTTLLLRARTVLLIEDDGAFRYAMGRMLRGAGADVVEATNLENALDALKRRPDIEAIVADVMLPDGLAPDALKRVEQQRALPVLYVTGYSDSLLREYGLSARDPHLLMKPFDAATLVSRLAAIGA